MYAVEVSDQIMIAHSFRGELFGPAQNVHGATFVVRVAFLADDLQARTIVRFEQRFLILDYRVAFSAEHKFGCGHEGCFENSG